MMPRVKAPTTVRATVFISAPVLKSPRWTREKATAPIRIGIGSLQFFTFRKPPM